MIRLILFFMLFASPVFGATQQVMINGASSFPDSTNTEYSWIMGRAVFNATSEADQSSLWPADGVLKGLRVVIVGGTDLGAGNSMKITIRVNGAEPGSPTQCTITNTENGCTDLTNDTALSAGDTVAVEFDPDDVPIAVQYAWSLVWQPTTENQSILSGLVDDSNLSTSATQFFVYYW